MEKLVDDGLVKSIGISNFSCKKIDTLLSYARIKPVAVQVEVHPYFRNQKLVDHCKAKVCWWALYTPCNLNSVTILMHCSEWDVLSMPITRIVMYDLRCEYVAPHVLKLVITGDCVTAVFSEPVRPLPQWPLLDRRVL